MIHLIFCFLHAAHAFTFLDILGSLLCESLFPCLLALVCVRCMGFCGEMPSVIALYLFGDSAVYDPLWCE
jgi:hypothetical protein